MPELTDVLGVRHRFDRPPSRVVSLVPSLTESLFDLGAGQSVAGATDYCLFPAEPLTRLPRVGGTKNPDVGAIRALGPDLVYLNLEENLRRHAEAIAEFAPVFATEPKSVENVIALLRQMGTIHRREEEAGRWITAIERELAALAGAAPFRFAVAIWKDPWMWCGGDTYVSDLVTRAGGTNVFAEERRYPKAAVEEAIGRGAGRIFLPDEPYAFTAEDAASISPSATAVGPFPGHFFTWHGTRTVQGLRFLSARRT